MKNEHQKEKTKVDELREVLKNKQQAEAKSKAEGCEKKASGEGKCLQEDEISEQIRAAEEDAKEHYDKLLRVMAEFENFKKRMKKERDEDLKYSNERLIKDILPSIDDLDRMLDHVPPDASDDVKKFVEGVELARKGLLSALEKNGLKEIPAIGEVFDPAHHEAIAVVESDAHEPGHVMALHRRGYWLHDRVLRPSMVAVAKSK